MYVFTLTPKYEYAFVRTYVQCDLVSAKLKEGLSLIQVVDEVRLVDFSLSFAFVIIIIILFNTVLF